MSNFWGAVHDLILCTEGYNGQHATSVNGTGRPTLQDFIAVGTKIKMTEKRCGRYSKKYLTTAATYYATDHNTIFLQQDAYIVICNKA